ncbi:AraC family transcriptional regulator [Actinomadura nitritigenes]|uniref:AraC family transcriptional regulator n=1 Tax=Actinomadura nitritigenes TaxID=134602 RepID=A0ABS3R8W1_9ACTN|nr:AraC family transcriptional regulator [Actinomadura nitritigenes]MBO2442669.1 AraC family transcriptional regulator [Actinomadura nitritigenes]
MDVLSDAISAMRLGRPHSSRTVLDPPWGVRFEPQQGAGFHVLLKGACWLIPTVGDPVRLSVGDVAFLPRELGHGIADVPDRPLADARSLTRLQAAGPAGANGHDADGRTEMLCGAYRLDQSRVHPLLAELPDVVHIPARIGRHPSLRGAIELLGRELDGGTRHGGDAALPALLDILLLYMVRAWYEDRPAGEATGWAAALRDPAVAAALRGVHDEPGRPWTVRSLAERAGLSRAAFARRFTATVGAPPLAYATWWRMTVAARLLRDTDLPLRAVAERVGYASEFAFAKAFKREFAEAPGRFRDAAGGDDRPWPEE